MAYKPPRKLTVPNTYGTSRGTVNVKRASKPPKLRFQPGQLVKYKWKDDSETTWHTVLYAFRLQENQHEWMYCVEQLDVAKQRDGIAAIAQVMGLGKNTPRIVYDLFRDSWDALKYFGDVPLNGDTAFVSNKTLLQFNPNENK